MTHNQRFHPQSLVETPHIGAGTRVWRNAHILEGACIGADCNIGENCYIEGHVIIGNGVTIKNNIALWDNITVEDDVFIGPAAVFTNDLRPRAFNKKTAADLTATRIERGATIGANATIVCGITIHEYAFVGAGAVVTRDVPAHACVLGNPARVQGYVCRCAQPIPEGSGMHRCGCGCVFEVRDDGVRVLE